LSKVAAALELLRSGEALTIADAARATGVPRTTVGDHWREENGGANPITRRTEADGLPESPGEMEVPVFHLDYSNQGSLHMYPMSDIHVGSPHFAEDVWDRWSDYLLHTDDVSMLFNGDGLNAAIIGSVSDTYSERMPVGRAMKALRAKLRPLAEADILDGITRGNHEQRLWRAVGMDPLEQIADEFLVPYTAHAMLLVYHVGDQEYRVFVRHGTGNGASTVGAQANQLERAARVMDADVYITGHTHSQLAFPRDVFRYRAGEGETTPLGNGRAYVCVEDRIERSKMLFVSSGSFLAYEPYAAERGFPPAHIGAPRLFLDGRRFDTHASV